MSGWQPNKHNREAIEVALIPISLEVVTKLQTSTLHLGLDLLALWTLYILYLHKL